MWGFELKANSSENVSESIIEEALVAGSLSLGTLMHRIEYQVIQ